MHDDNRGRLLWRCRRGMRELDLVLSRFVDDHLKVSTAGQQRAFRQLLDRPDPEILDLLTGQVVAEDRDLNYVVERLRQSR